MIMEWKKQTDGSYHAKWRGISLVLAETSVTQVTTRGTVTLSSWYLIADGLLVKQTWPSSRKAMDDIEQRQTKRLRADSAAFLASKQAPSGEVSANLSA
jgi:hypothetical protein